MGVHRFYVEVVSDRRDWDGVASAIEAAAGPACVARPLSDLADHLSGFEAATLAARLDARVTAGLDGDAGRWLLAAALHETGDPATGTAAILTAAEQDRIAAAFGIDRGSIA